MTFSPNTLALPDVAMPLGISVVVLFGSHARATAHALSDVDLGVLGAPGQRLDYRQLGALHVALGRWAGRSVDVVDLHTDDAVFRYEVVKDARVLFEAAPGNWTAFVAKTLIDYDEMAPFVAACTAAVIESRDQDRSAVSPTLVARKLASIHARVARVRALLPATSDDFIRQRTEAEALILNLFLALQECSDLALHMVAARALGVPGDARSAFDLLASAGMIDAALAGRLAGAVGLRNRIAHEYGRLDLVRVFEAARDDLGDLEGFAAAVATAVAAP